jgi:hypothetical protein
MYPMRITRAVGVVCTSAALLALAACGHSDGSSSAENKAKAVASSSANVTAENAVKTQVTTCVNNTKPSQWLTKSGRQTVVNCLESLVLPAQRDQFKQCALKTAVTDKAWTRDGLTMFENSGVAACVTKATGPTPTAVPSATASK